MSIARNAGYDLAGKLLPLAVSLVTVPLYLRVIGIERYGVLSLCWLMLGYLGFLELGTGPSVQQRIASLRRGSAADRSEVFWTGFWLSLVMSFVGAAALYFGARLYFDTLDDVSSDLSREIESAIPWLALIVPVVMANSLLAGVMRGRERFFEVNLVSSASSILMAILPLCAAYVFHPRLSLLVAISLMARAAAVAVQFFQVRRAVPLGPMHAPRWALIRSLLSFGGWVSVTTILTPILASFDRLAIGSMLGAAAVALYTIPYSLAWRTAMLSKSLGSALLPRFAASSATQRDSLEREAIATIATLMTPLTLGGVLVIGPFLRIWIGEDLGARAEPIAAVFLVGWWSNAFAVVAKARLEGGGRPDIVTKLLLVELPFYFATLWAAMHWLGLFGAALTWTLRATVDPIALLGYTRQLRGFVPRFLLHGALVCGAATISIVMDYQHPLRWILLLLILGLGIGLCAYTAPPRLVEMRRVFAKRLIKSFRGRAVARSERG